MIMMMMMMNAEIQWIVETQRDLLMEKTNLLENQRGHSENSLRFVPFWDPPCNLSCFQKKCLWVKHPANSNKIWSITQTLNGTGISTYTYHRITHSCRQIYQSHSILFTLCHFMYVYGAIVVFSRSKKPNEVPNKLNKLAPLRRWTKILVVWSATKSKLHLSMVLPSLKLTASKLAPWKSAEKTPYFRKRESIPTSSIFFRCKFLSFREGYILPMV